MSWKPIDLAPRDGSTIVAVFRSSLDGTVSAAVVTWKSEGWVCPVEADAPAAGDVAFAWTPLPEDLGSR